MAGYINSGIDDGQFVFVSGSSWLVNKPGTYLINAASGNVGLGGSGTVTIASGVFGVNGLAPAVKFVDIAGSLGNQTLTIAAAAGSNLTFNGSSTASISSAYGSYTGVIYSGTNFIKQ